MTQDEIIEMARQHLCRVEYDNGDVHECYEFSLEELEAFAKLVAAKEREACAKVVEPSADYRENFNDYLGGEESIALLDNLASLIRARGNQA
jgi:hypothetical protein